MSRACTQPRQDQPKKKVHCPDHAPFLFLFLFLLFEKVCKRCFFFAFETHPLVYFFFFLHWTQKDNSHAGMFFNGYKWEPMESVTDTMQQPNGARHHTPTQHTLRMYTFAIHIHIPNTRLHDQTHTWLILALPGSVATIMQEQARVFQEHTEKH
jgi:hypothetical protein